MLSKRRLSRSNLQGAYDISINRNRRSTVLTNDLVSIKHYIGNFMIFYKQENDGELHFPFISFANF